MSHARPPTALLPVQISSNKRERTEPRGLQCEVDGDGPALQFCDTPWKTLERVALITTRASNSSSYRVHCGTTQVSFFSMQSQGKTRTAPSGARGIFDFLLGRDWESQDESKKSRWRQERRAAGLDWDCDWDFFTGTGTRKAFDIMPLSNLSRWLGMCHCSIVGVTRRVGYPLLIAASATDIVQP